MFTEGVTVAVAVGVAGRAYGWRRGGRCCWSSRTLVAVGVAVAVAVGLGVGGSLTIKQPPAARSLSPAPFA